MQKKRVSLWALACALAAMVMMLALAACGDSTKAPVLESRTAFVITTAAPSEASEGVQYKYIIGTTDLTFTSFQLGRAPQNASLGGNVLLWTPTEEQARVGNDFELRATHTSTGTTVTQWWTVAPRGTVKVTMSNTHITNAGDRVMAATPSGTLYASSGSGDYTPVEGVVADGIAVYSYIPAGYYWFKVREGSWCWTDKSTIDLGTSILGRPDVQRPTKTTKLEFDLSGLSPWDQNLYVGPTYYDELVWFVPNAGVHASFYPLAAAGATSLHTTSEASYWALSDASKGDEAYLYQMVNDTVSTYPVRQIVAFAKVSVTQADGSTTLVQASLTPPPRDQEWPLNIDGPAFAALDFSINPKATPIVAYPEGMVMARPGGGDLGWVGWTAFLVSYGQLGTGTVAVAVPYSNPFPSDWLVWWYHSHNAYFQRTVPGTSVNTMMLGQITTSTLKPATGAPPLEPIVGPVSNPTINGVDFFVDQNNVGVTPKLDWGAPAVGTARGYSVDVRGWSASAGFNFDSRTVIYTSTNSITLPPGVLLPGRKYVFVIQSVSEPLGDYGAAPNRWTFPRGTADAISGFMSP